MKSVETVQAMWRGRSARAAVTPVLLMRRRELHERRCMEGEEERCVCVAVAEAKREKEEREREKAELEAMRYIPFARSARGATGHAVGYVACLVEGVFHAILMVHPDISRIPFRYSWRTTLGWHSCNCSGAMKRERDAAGLA